MSSANDEGRETAVSAGTACSTGGRSVAFLWSGLGSELRQSIVDSGKVDTAARNKEPLVIVVAPGETALMAVGSGAIYETLHKAFERTAVVNDIPETGWHVRVLFDQVKSSL